jgi:hypothetical protein
LSYSTKSRLASPASAFVWADRSRRHSSARGTGGFFGCRLWIDSDPETAADEQAAVLHRTGNRPA